MEVPDQHQTTGLSLPVLCINVEDRLRAVEHVQRDLETLEAKQAAKVAEIAAANPDEPDTLEKLQRELASVNARITPMDDAMRARLSHIYRPSANSA